MTAIADADLQRLFAAAINEQQLAQGIVNTSHDAFCAALNERLEAADALAIEGGIICTAIKVGAGGCIADTLMQADFEHALAAYRQSKERSP